MLLPILNRPNLVSIKPLPSELNRFPSLSNRSKLYPSDL